MEHSILKKRLNTFKSAKGTLKDVSDEVVLEVLRAWENWPGVTSNFVPRDRDQQDADGDDDSKSEKAC